MTATMAAEPMNKTADEMTATEAVQKLRDGEPIIGVRIGRLQLRGTFEHPIVLERCECPHLQIEQATFAGSVTLQQCKIRRMRIGRKTNFAAEVNLTGCTLHSTVIRQASFAAALKTNRMTLTAHTKIEQSTFGGDVKGFGLVSDDWIEWSRCTIAGNVDLRSMELAEGFVMSRCTVVGDVNLRGSTIHKKLQLDQTSIAGTLDLAKTKLHDFVYLQDMIVTDTTRFRFVNAIADFIHVEPEQLEGRLASENDGCPGDAILEYGLLKRCYSTLHRYEEEDWAFYRFKVAQRRCRGWSWRRPGSVAARVCNYLFLDIGCGYGVQPGRALLFGAFVILAFALMYATGMQHFADANPPIRELAADGMINRGLFGLLASVSVFTAGFTGDHLQGASGWVLLPLAVEAVLGTVLWGLFIVAFSRKVIR